MVNKGPDSNASAFFFTLQPTQWLDRKNVVFGQVVEGMDFLAEIENHGSDQGNTNKIIEITGCGEV